MYSINKLNINIEFKPRKRLSVVVFDFETDIDKQLLNISIFVNKYRNCFENPLYEERGKYWANEFICEAISPEHYKNETNDLPSSITAIIQSDNNFKFELKSVEVYQFIESCGTPDIPLHARQTITIG